VITPCVQWHGRCPIEPGQHAGSIGVRFVVNETAGERPFDSVEVGENVFGQIDHGWAGRRLPEERSNPASRRPARWWSVDLEHGPPRGGTRPTTGTGHLAAERLFHESGPPNQSASLICRASFDPVARRALLRRAS
jgi:hypothetical protein